MQRQINPIEEYDMITAEQLTLGALMIKPEVIDDVLEVVREKDFFSSNHQIMANAIFDLHFNEEPVDLHTIGHKLVEQGRFEEIGALYILEMYELTPSAENVLYYANIVADYSKRRRLMKISEDMGDSVYDAPVRSISEVVESVQSAISDIEQDEAKENINQAAKEVLKEWNAIETGENVKRLRSGWNCVDQRWKGLRGGEFVVVAGTTGTGKTIFGMQIATINAMQGNRPMVFSLEMSQQEIYRRMVGMVGKIPISMADSEDSNERIKFYNDHSTALTVAVTKLKDLDMPIDSEGAIHINDLCIRARREHKKSPLSMILVDYLQLVRGEGQNREREMAYVSSRLKRLAKSLDIPVIALCQFNREASKGGRPSMSQLRDSGAIEQDADVVTLLYRPDKDTTTEDDHAPGLVEVITAKHRRAGVGIDSLKGVLNQFRMEEWTHH